MSSFYDDLTTTFPYIEKAVLMEDVKLPILNGKKKLKRGFFYSLKRLIPSDPEAPITDIYYDNYKIDEVDKEYKLAYNEIKNIDAKFFIPVLMPTFNNVNNEININNRAPKTTGFKSDITSLPYSSSNCVTLTIPKYIILQFIDLKNEIPGSKDPIIPKGTQFLVACAGGMTDLDQMRIIGLFTLTYDKKSFPNLTDEYYGGNPVK